jgi:uncharacterized protein (TIGR04222 family)
MRTIFRLNQKSKCELIQSMYPYAMYLLYVGAVIGFCVLLLRRSWRRRIDVSAPEALKVALLRGGAGAVTETLIFELHQKKIIELKADGTGRKLLAKISPAHRGRVSKLEEAAIQAFAAIQGNLSALGEARRALSDSMGEMEDSMQKAGWWKAPARWRRILTILAPGLIVAGSFRFLNYYEGWLQWALALTVPLLALIGLRIVRREMSGPTNSGKELLEHLRREADNKADPVMQVALHGTEYLAQQPDYRVFHIMTRGVPYEYL